MEYSKKYVEQILLTVADDNKPAINFYKNFWFSSLWVRTNGIER